MRSPIASISAVAVVTVVCARVTIGGDLNPPAGPVAPTPGPEPRTPIDATDTPGDADSFYKITAPGSYYLTGNLTGVTGKHGIEITSSNVTIDLMGFDVVGVPGSLDGIVVTVADLKNIEIRNGNVRSWGSKGIDLESGQWANFDSRIEQVRVSDTGYTGIHGGVNTIIADCIVSHAGWIGIIAPSGVVERCAVEFSSSTGIAAGGAAVTGCSVSFSSADGISCGLGSVVSGCTVVQCSGDGIDAQGRCMVRDNVCSFNGYLTGTGAGIIVTGNRCRIVGNHCTDADIGIDVNGNNNLIDSNSVDYNSVGFDVDGADNLVIRNTATANAPNYSVAAGNSVAPRVTVTDSDGWSGISNNSHPWANLAY